LLRKNNLSIFAPAKTVKILFWWDWESGLKGHFFGFGLIKFIGIIGIDSVNQRRFRTNHFGAGLRDCIEVTYNI